MTLQRVRGDRPSPIASWEWLRIFSDRSFLDLVRPPSFLRGPALHLVERLEERFAVQRLRVRVRVRVDQMLVVLRQHEWGLCPEVPV